MPDELDQLLQGTDDQSSASPAQTEGQQTDFGKQKATEQQTEEEVEFNKLPGHTQERVRELLRRAKDAETRLAASVSYIPPAPNTLASDQQQAINTLSQFGIATDEKVDKKLAEGLNSLRWDMEQTRLSQKYVGTGGEPQYVREEVEDYIRNHPQYQGYAPEDVFRYKMFPDEFLNLELQKGSPKTKTSSIKPTKAETRQEALTPEYIEERLKQPDGQQWYENNLDEINNVVKNYTLQFKGQV